MPYLIAPPRARCIRLPSRGIWSLHRRLRGNAPSARFMPCANAPPARPQFAGAPCRARCAARGPCSWDRMSPIAVPLLAFGLALVGLLLGSFMQRILPEGQLSSDSKEVVKLSMGVVATLAALVLGLLVASAKSTYDARERKLIRSPLTSSCSIPCLPNMERELKRASFAAPSRPSNRRSNLE
jgi:hypothetical protein